MDQFILTRLTPLEGRENKIYYTDDADNNIMIAENKRKLKLVATAVAQDYWLLPVPMEVHIEATDGNVTKRAAVFWQDSEYKTIDIPLDLEGLEGEIFLQFSSPEVYRSCAVVNPKKIQEKGEDLRYER